MKIRACLNDFIHDCSFLSLSENISPMCKHVLMPVNKLQKSDILCRFCPLKEALKQTESPKNC